MHATLVTMFGMIGWDSFAFALIIAWTLPWKLYSLWIAARRGDIKWFIALAILNTLAILDIYYLFKVAHITWADIKALFKSKSTLAK